MFRLKELNPQEGDVIRIKFKSINKIVEENIGTKPFHEIEDYYGLQNHIKAYISGGDFLVESAPCIDEDYKNDPYIEVKNHLDSKYSFAIHESTIESIEIADAAETFMSNDLKMIAVRIGNEMFINGHPMIWDEKDQIDDDDNYKNHNRKLIRMFESFITDLAVQDTFQQPEEEG